MRLATCQASRGVARKIQIQQLPRAFPAEVGKGRALHDAKLKLRGSVSGRIKATIPPGAFLKMFAGTARPFRGALHCGCGMAARRGALDALIEHHGNVGAKRELHLDGLLRRQQTFRGIQVRQEEHALVRDFPQPGKAEDLISARIGQDRARPGHELVQAAQIADERVSRPEIEMIGVGEKNLRAEIFEGLLRKSLDRPGRADGQEHGRVNRAVRGVQAAKTRGAGVFVKNFKDVSHPGKCSSRVATLLQARCLLKLRQMAAQPTLSKTQTSQSPKTTPNADPALIFFGFAAENPIANRMRIQIQDSSRELPSATSNLAPSLPRKELTLVATMCSGSTAPGDFSASVRMANIEVMADGIVACVAIANEVEYFNPAPVNRLNDAQ